MSVEKLKAALPVTIFRPAVVCGDSKTGETPKYDGIYYLIKYLRKSPGILSKINIGNPSVRLNFVPVDSVVYAMAALSGDDSLLWARLSEGSRNAGDAAAAAKANSRAQPAPGTTPRKP